MRNGSQVSLHPGILCLFLPFLTISSSFSLSSCLSRPLATGPRVLTIEGHIGEKQGILLQELSVPHRESPISVGSGNLHTTAHLHVSTVRERDCLFPHSLSNQLLLVNPKAWLVQFSYNVSCSRAALVPNRGCVLAALSPPQRKVPAVVPHVSNLLQGKHL